MTYAQIYDCAKSIIGSENVLDYRPASYSNGFEQKRDEYRDSIVIWLKNGDEIIYTAKPYKTIEQIMDELIQEAQNEPEWKTESALKCAKRILLAEYKPYSPMSQIKQDVNGLGYMWRCPICQKDIHEGDKYCSNCGRKMKWN